MIRCLRCDSDQPALNPNGIEMWVEQLSSPYSGKFCSALCRETWQTMSRDEKGEKIFGRKSWQYLSTYASGPEGETRYILGPSSPPAYYGAQRTLGTKMPVKKCKHDRAQDGFACHDGGCYSISWVEAEVQDEATEG